MKLEHQDYPGLFLLADKYSLDGQRKYLTWFRLELVALVVATIISLLPDQVSSNDPDFYKRLIMGLSALFFIIGIGITYFIKDAHFQDRWYIGRAVAESIKSLTWKYMIKADPYLQKLSEKDSDQLFITTLQDLFRKNKNFLNVTYQEETRINITPKMKAIRALDFQERKELYIQGRIQDQLRWYINKAAKNRKNANVFFWVVIGMQTIALIYCIYLIIQPDDHNFVPLFTTLTAVFLSWLQTKQYRELAQSYAVTANEISLILDSSTQVNTEEELAAFVSDSERAFSREHTLWLARKEVLSY